MDVPDEVVLDVDMLADDGSEDDGEAPPSSEFYLGPASTPTSCASSPRGEEPASPHGSTGQLSFFHHQPYARPFFTSARRGPGRPRKEGVKLAKEGKIVRRYKNPGSVRGAKRHRGSRDDALDEVLDDDDFTMPAPSEEPPYFPEKWTGKLCALCNLGERSQLGQGDMLQFICSIGELEPPPSVPSSGAATPTNPAGTPTGTPTPTTPSTPGLGSPELVDPNQHPLAMPLSRRQKGYNKCKTPLYNMEHTDELSIIGHQEAQEMIAVVSNRFFYVHSKCLKFSAAQDQTAAVPSPEDEKDQTAEDARVRVIVAIALQRKCAFCQKHGASLACKMTCNKFFHLPCVLASGGFMDFPALLSFCKDHLYQVPLICPSDVECRMCRVVGDVANLMTCAACGAHYHGTCVGLAQLPGVRSGWCCRACRCCQICRGEAGGAGGAEPRAVACEHCDKLYHAACLRPPITTVPKYGWKCKCCRVCSDCGARSPGAGPSSRWHAHYTVCDSCYQQRNKGSCCPLCRRAYRAAAMRDMIRCHTCKRYVHGTCDNDAEPAQYRERKQQNPLYEYHCPMCKTQAILTGSNTSFEEENMPSTSQDSSFGDDNSQEQDPLAIETKSDVGLGKGKPYTASKVAKKKLGGYKHKGGFSAAGKMGFQKRCRSSLSEFGRKRTSKPKMRGVFGVPGLGLQRPQAPDNKTPEDDPGVENKLVLCSSKDKFVLTQDLCVMCGAVGTDSEGCLIACAQCGQSYHPYCVNIKVSSVIVSLGWRCLDCTVCEGCGSRGDDALLVLCDDCDTAWHTYCATPALGEVPRGPWRCERCRRCLLCGTRAAKSWCDNYTECGPCASFVMCCVCSEPYSDGELIIQCLQCKRWLHAACDSIRNERDAEICCRADYNCVLCRGVAVPPPHVSLSPPRSPPRAPAPPRPAHLTPQALGLGGEYYVDEVCLSQRGAQHMKQLEAEMGITHARRKRRFKNDDKEAVVQSADADAEESKPDSSTVDVKEEPGAAPYKEGIMWNVSTDGPPPEGFTIYTMETGVTVLRRKRQRNLNKLGIGGFVVRQRQTTLKQQAEDEKDGDGTQAGESPSNKRKPRRKLRSKLMEQFPSYMQEAFFGKELLESKPAVSSTGNPLEVAASSLRPATPEGYRELRDLQVNFDSESDDEELTQALSGGPADDTLLTLNADEIKLLDSLQPKEDPDAARVKTEIPEEEPLKHTEDSTALRNAILGPQSAEVTEQPANTESIPTVHSSKTEAISDAGGSSQTSTISPKDELSLMGVSLDAMVRDSLPDMDGTDVEEIFKGVLTDDSQESQESSVSYATSMAGTPYSQQRQQLQSPMEYASPYHHEFGSGNSALSPAFSESGAAAWGEAPASAPTPSYNQRSAEKMKADESLGSAATISAVLYANTNHPEWRTEFPSWQDRCKQILKKWRALPADQKAPYLQQARDNRSAIRMRKAQQSSPSGSASGPAGASSPASPPPPPPAAAAPPPPLPPPPPSPAVTSAAPVRAPNVTVTAGGLLEADAHIRVLTPSEIMRTLPPLHQAHTEQERACGQQRSAREAEQERQWKQLQQMRQLQTQQQQQIIHDQRAQAHHRLRAPDGSELPPLPALPEGAPRSAFPAQRFPHHYGNSEDINRQLRDLLQRHPDKSWPPQGGVDDGSVQQVNMEGQPFRHPLPVGGVAVRPRPPLLPGQQLIMQQRLVAPENPQIQHNPQMQNQQEQKPNVIVQPNAQGDSKPESAGTQEQGRDEIDMGDMEKLEQDTANIGEVGDILTGLGGEDDEELLVSLTAEMGEEFNILEYADPELASLDDAEHILDGLELAEETTTRHAKREPPEEIDEKPDIKAAADLQPKPEPAKGEGPQRVGTQMWQETMNRYISQLQQKQQQQQQQPQMQHIKTEVKVEGGATEWRAAPAQPGHFQQRLVHQHALQQQGQLQRPAQFAGGSLQQQMQPRQFAPGPQHMHAQQGGVQTVQNVQNINTQNIVNAMTAQVNAAIAAGRNVVQGNKCVGADGSVGIVRHDRSVALVSLPGQAGVSRAPPPPPYPGTLRPPQPPPPPYPQQVGYEADGWADWLQRRPLLLQNVNQEQPLLLEELLEQEKREQETGGGGPLLTGAGSAGVEWAAAPAPAAPLYSRAPPPQPPPPDPPGDLRARRLYESWLQQYKAFATDQLNYYEQEVTKLRKIRKSLNSKQRQLRKSGNELAPNDAAELRRVSTEQSALQKHLESARKQARQHSMLIQEYETKQRQNNPAPLNNQTNQIFAQNQNMTASPQLQQQGGINRPMQIGLQNTNVQQQQTLIRTQQVIGSDGQLSQQRIGLVTSPMGAQGRILQGVQGGRTLVIEQAAGQQQQLVRQLSATQERPQSVGMVQFGQQQLSGARPAGNAPRPQSRPAMSPLHVQSPHSQSPLHSLAPQSPLHHLTSPMQSPLHSQQSPLHHTAQSLLHPSTQSPLHTQQSPLHSQQSPLQMQQTNLPQQSPMHQSPMHQSPMHQSPLHQSPLQHHQQQMQSQSPLHMQQSPMHSQQSPMHTQQSPMQSAMSPQHFLQQLQAQRTSPQLPTPSRSPQIYQQGAMSSPVSSHSPQLQSGEYGGGRFPRPSPGCSPLQGRFARPPLHQQGMRAGGPFGGRQTSPHGSPQSMPSPGNPANEMARQLRQQYSPMPAAPPSPHPARSPRPSPAPSPAGSEHGGGGHHMQAMPMPPGYRYFKPGLFGGAPVWPDRDGRLPHINKVSILKRTNTPPRQRFTGKTAPPPEEEAGDSREYVLYAPDGVDYAPVDDNRMSFDDDDVEEIVEEHLDDADIVVVEPAAISPQERIATEEDFEELIDSGKPEDEEDEPAPAEKATRTETTTKTVAVISLSTAKQSPNVQQYKLMNPTQSSSLSRLPLLSATVLSPHANTKMLNEVSQATVASVSIANQTISVPVLKNFPRSGVPGHSGGLSKQQLKKMPLNITNTPMSINMSKTILANPSSYISVISPSVPKVATVSPVISLATSNTTGTPVSILSQHQVKQKIVKTIEKPMGLSLSNTKLSSLSVTHDVTLPAKIFQDDAASPDSTVALETNPEKDLPLPSMTQPEPLSPPPKEPRKDIDIESEISQQTELPPALCLTDGTPLLLGKSDIKSPDPIPEKIPDNIMEGDDDDKPEETLPDLLLAYNKPAAPEPATAGPSATRPPKRDEPDLQTIKAIANQTKEMVIGSNMQITTDMAQDSVQISIPSPTPSQERYLNDMAQRNVVDNTKNDESFEDMLSLIENISDEPKMYAKPAPKPSLPPPSLPPPKTETKQPEPAPKPSPPERNVQQATVPQLSPLSQQAELNSSMANVSQQLRTIMSSLNPPAKAEPLSAPAAKILDTMAPTQVNFENLLPSSKVEVPVSRPSPLQRNEKPGSLMPNAESTHISAAQMIGSRVNTLSSMAQNRKSPTASPMNSPAAMQNVGTLTKSPAQSPLISNQGFAPTEDTTTTIASQIIQMPALSKINSNSTVPPMPMIHSNTVTTSSGGFQNTQVLPTSILGHTLLQPARQISATNLPFNTQSISSSQPPALVMTSRPTLGNKEAPPNVTVRPHNVITTGMPQVAGAKPSGTINFITSSKLLHTQLTSPLKRSKSTDEPKTEAVVGHIQPTKRHSVESVIVKSEPVETDDSSTPGASDKQLTAAQRHDESQNVLLKQLLQTSTATAATVPPRNMNIQRTAPALGTIPSLEAQLARPSIPPAMTIAQEVEPPKNSPRQMAPQSTVFNTRPIQSPAMTTVPSSMSPLIQTSTQSLMDVRKPPPIKVLKEETTPQPESSPVMKTMYQLNLENQQQLHQQHQQQQQQQQQLLQQPQHMQHQQIQQQQIHQQHQTQQQHQIHQQHQMQQNQHIQQPQHQLHLQQQQIQQLQHMQQLQQMMKKEVAAPQQSPVHRPFTPMDVKKELLDESSQQSATSGVSTASDQGKLDQPIKEEFPENVSMDISSEANAPETPSEAKKRKRREYQQKKRKMLLNMKAQADNTMSATVKKRPRKGSRFEEDYDTFIDNLISQLRLIPPMQIQEPTLNTNFAVCPLFGSGELTKLKNKDYDTLKGDLTGSFGNAKIPNVGDYYNTKPFGEDEPLPERPPASTQRGFYDQEFQPITFEDDTDEKKLEFTCKERDTDTPDTIVSCSSPECLEIDPPERFPGLRLIDDEDDDDDSDSGISGRVSPIVPLIAPVPIRLKPVSLCQLKEEETALVKVEETIKTNPSSPGSESSENVTVTLTLTSGAAEDILGVLKELAGILHIPPPTAYQIVERTATPPSHKLGLYRSKGKDGKEGAPIDIQSILNGAAKFCRHCDVVILDSVVRAKASEFPLLSENKEGILCDSDSELFFCSAQCYERFSWRPTNIILDGKSKTTVKDEKCETDPNVSKERDDFDTASTESMETDDLDIKPDIKDEKMDLFIDSLDNDELMKEVGDDVTLDEDIKQEDKPTEPVVKEKFRGIVYKAWSPNCIGPTVKYKRPTDRELAELVFRTGVAIMPVTNEDSRRCELCGIQGDGVADGVARLLNCDVDRWVHLNCALWSEGVYETVSGALMNVDSALAAGSNATCAVCRRLGATVRCFKVRCGSVYHLGCAVKDSCVFYKNKTAYCASHAPKGEKDNELTTLSVQRRVFISRDEQRQVASVMLHSDSNHLIRVGGLIFLSPGHLLPHQLATFHTPNYIYPPGYKCVRFYWSMSRANSRCRYLCWISDEAGRPMFHVRAQDDQRDDMTAPTARAAWSKVLDAVAALRESRTEEGVLKLWPNYVTGEDLFGLTEPAVVRVLESLPGIETLTDYRFKFGRSALLEGGLAVNPHGCARAAPRPRAAAAPFRRAAPRAAPAAAGPAPAPASTDLACPYTKQFVHTKSSQYKKMKSEWRNNVYLARSKIQGLGLFAARDLEKHTMIIEYIGEIIRSELSEKREKMYEARNRGIYMFRLDERRVVDATISGGLARYINHSCQPNCVTELVELERTLKIVIFAKRHIHRGEELAYDYKFDIEDDAHKIMCMCGAPNCRKWMN